MLEDAVAWFEGSVESQRETFCCMSLSGSGVSFTELCSRFQISRKTGYKWLKRYAEGGSEALTNLSRAPHLSPRRTSDKVEAKVVKLRVKHPGWGGRKIRRRLLDKGVVDVPAPATITDILHRHGLIEPAEPHAGGFISFEADNPNDMWQMDFKGWFMADTGRCEPLDVLDDHSRYNLMLKVCENQYGTTVKGALTNTFGTFGIPKWMLLDNGQPWGTKTGGFRWTVLTVWMLDLGISVTHSRPRHPQTLGKLERFHRTLKLEVISARNQWESHQQVQQAFDEWQHVYNYQRPHDALDLDVPASRYKPSERSMPTTIEPVDYPDGYDVRKVSTEGRIRFNGDRYRVGKAFIGRNVGVIPTTTDGIFDVHYRHQRVATIDLSQ